MPPKQQLVVKGAPSSMYACLDHLACLVRELPSHLPDNPATSAFNFSLDPEDVKHEGYWYAFNHTMQASFGLGQGPSKIVIGERGQRLTNLIHLFRLIMKEVPENRELFRTQWLEPVILAVKEAGSSIPPR